MDPAHLVLIRHAHTAPNGSKRPAMSGWTDFPLSDLGRRQVRRLELRLAGGPTFAAVYSSPLRRALDTARPLCERGLTPLYIREGLREIGCGEVDGLTVEEVKQRFSDEWARNMEQTDDDFRWPGGESYRELRERCLCEVHAIASAHAGERVAVVTHAGVISQLLGWMHGSSAAKWGAFRPENTALTEVLWTEDRWTLIAFDDRSHLEDGASSRPQGVRASNDP